MELPEFIPSWNILPGAQNKKYPIGKWVKYQTERFPRKKLDDYNNCNFLALCGKTSGNLMAIDLDFKKSMSDDEIWDAFSVIVQEFDKECPDLITRVHQTPHGFHLVYHLDFEPNTKHYKNLYAQKKENTIFLGTIYTRFHEYLNGLDFQGEGALIMIPPSMVDSKQYKILNNAEIKTLNEKEFLKLKNFFLLEEPKSMRSHFIDILNGIIEIESYAARTGQKELVYWKYLFIEAYHGVGLHPQDLFPLLAQNQPAFDEKKTLKQLSYPKNNYLTIKPLTPKTYLKYFGSYGSDVVSLKKKKKKQKEVSEELSVKELTDQIANLTTEEFPILTLDDSRQIMVKENNHYSFKTNEMYLFIKQRIDELSRGSYTTYKRNVEEIIRDGTLFNRKDFNTNSGIINFRNGVFDVMKEEFHPIHNGIFFYCIPHKFVQEEYNCPKFEKALDEWLIPSDKSNIIIYSDIYEMIGLCMSTHTGFKKSFINIGPKDSGKTQFTNIITHIIGEDNTEAIPLQRMTKDHFGTVGLQMKLLNVAGELGTSAVKNPETFKTLTGDDFKVPAEIKGGRQFKFRNFSKFWFNGNNFPEVHEAGDLAFFERFIIIFFPNVFKQTDKHFKLKFFETICTPKEVAGIIQKSLKGLKRLIERKGFRPEIQQNTRHLWLYESDPVYKFLEDCCEKDHTEKIKKTIFYDIFQDMTDKWVSKNKFTAQLQRFGIISKQLRDEGTPSSRSYYYVGVKLKSEIEDMLIDAQFETKKLDANEILGFMK